MTVLDIRGTHGSGKSWIVHQLIAEAITREYQSGYISEEGSTEAIATYIPTHHIAALGMYDRVCGGCDGIRSAEEVCRRVRLLAHEYTNVILEGILVAHTFQRYANLAKEILLSDEHHPYIFCFINTPYEVCIQRVQERRVARGKAAEFNLFHLTQDFHRCHERLPKRFAAEGYTVEILDWENPMPQIKALLAPVRTLLK